MSDYGIFSWYPIDDYAKVLMLDGSKNGFSFDFEKRYDYIFASHLLFEIYENNAEEKLSALRKLLNSGGKIIFAEDNRNSAHFLTTACDKYKYSLTKTDIITLLDRLDDCVYKFYYPLVSLETPQCIYTDISLPKEDFSERFLMDDYAIISMHKDEKALISDAISQNAFQFVANGYFVEVVFDGTSKSDISYATVNMKRRKSDVFATIIYSCGKVLKKYVFEEGKESLQKIYNNYCTLKERGIPILPMENSSEGLLMDFVSEPTVQEQLRILINNKNQDDIYFIFDRLWDYILKSSDYMSAQYYDMPILKQAYIEMIPMNSFWINNDFVFFDQEFVTYNCPAIYVLLRAIRNVYAFIDGIQNIISMQQLLIRYNVTNRMWQDFLVWDTSFLNELNVEAKISVSFDSKDYMIVQNNFERMKINLEKSNPFYKVGFVPGVFDMLHRGHINLLKKCKQHCAYLIVGVLIDDLVEEFKGKRPIFSVEDRVLILEACKYADEVVIIDYHNVDKLHAWELYHYDCHFSGDDHKEEWKVLKEQLRSRGADMMFFDYTKGISSTALRSKI